MDQEKEVMDLRSITAVIPQILMDQPMDPEMAEQTLAQHMAPMTTDPLMMVLESLMDLVVTMDPLMMDLLSIMVVIPLILMDQPMDPVMVQISDPLTQRLSSARYLHSLTQPNQS